MRPPKMWWYFITLGRNFPIPVYHPVDLCVFVQ